jgi:nitrite reductase/ring-hydroxylating ferredoxin subunit
MALRVHVCQRSDVPAGSHRGFAVRGVTWPILVANLDGELIATAGVCPHEDVSLIEGHLEDDQIVCPGHGYHFDLVTGRCAHAPGLVLRRYRVTVIGEDVWVDLI